MTPPEPDGDLSRMLVHLSGLTFWGTAALMVTGACVGSVFFQGWGVWMLYRITGSSWGRRWTARWWARALPPVALVLTVAAVLTEAVWLLIPAVVMMMALLPVALWRFLSGMTRPGSSIHRSIQWPGWVMTAMTTLGTAMGIAAMLPAGNPFDSAPLTGVITAAMFLVLGSYVFLLLPLWSLTQVWVKGAGKPVEHVKTIGDHLRAQGMTTSGTERRLTAKDSDLTIEVDFAQAPARILIIVPVELPLGLSVRARREGDPPGVSMGDPMLRELLLVTADDHDAARRHLSGMHEALLANLHAWPDSTLSGGVLQVEMTGPPFHPPGRIRPEAKPNAKDTLEALMAQLEDAHHLAEALRQPDRPAVQPQRRPIRETLPQ